MLKGIDVSSWQGVIDWNKVKASGIDYAILRVGYGDDIPSQDDKYFRRNADECTRLGIPFGVYIYSYATSVAQAKSEAEHTLRLIKGYKLDYPVYYDLEDGPTTGTLSNAAIANLAKNYCDIIEAAGYWVGIYANKYWFTNKLTDSVFNNWVKWVAQYASSCTYAGSYDMWQYASDGQVPGVNGNCDVNYCYKDYPSLINSKPSTPSPQPTPPQVQDICDREIKRYPESGTCTIVASDGIYFRDKPCTCHGSRQGTYSCGESVNYDLVVLTEKYVWISWISLSTGTRRYMPIVDKRANERWGNCV